jgi:hypothetical protein
MVVGEFADECRADPVAHYLPLAVLHEEMHCALAASVRWSPDALQRPLVAGLQEPVAVLAELYVEHLLRTGDRPTRGELRRLTATHPDGTRARRIIDCCQTSVSAEAVVRTTVGVAQRALRSATDDHLVRELNKLHGLQRRCAWWRRSFA